MQCDADCLCSQLQEELLKLHAISTTFKKRRRRIHFPSIAFALSFRLHSSNCFDLSASLATLRGVKFRKKPVSLGARFSQFENFITNNQCRFSIKVALAALVYSVFFLAPSLQQSFFIPYGELTLRNYSLPLADRLSNPPGMTSSLITVIVGITPSLGQSYVDTSRLVRAPSR